MLAAPQIRKLEAAEKKQLAKEKKLYAGYAFTDDELSIQFNTSFGLKKRRDPGFRAIPRDSATVWGAGIFLGVRRSQSAAKKNQK